MADKKRVDVALVERGLASSREKAQALVMSGVVYIGENKVTKASVSVMDTDELIVRQVGTGYVSRGALKLEKGLKVMDAAAFAICNEQKMPLVRVFGLDDPRNLLKVLDGDDMGSFVHP